MHPSGAGTQRGRLLGHSHWPLGVGRNPSLHAINSTNALPHTTHPRPPGLAPPAPVFKEGPGPLLPVFLSPASRRPSSGQCVLFSSFFPLVPFFFVSEAGPHAITSIFNLNYSPVVIAILEIASNPLQPSPRPVSVITPSYSPEFSLSESNNHATIQPHPTLSPADYAKQPFTALLAPSSNKHSP